MVPALDDGTRYDDGESGLWKLDKPVDLLNLRAGSATNPKGCPEEAAVSSVYWPQPRQVCN